ncbi:hypothetical protein LRS13_12660 [Svornostia abyssi]|uniref:Uncharacterized protein n=1 Tax=Svornostia abyssi TaxID=2898438 RepID=A0ABY5PAC6_9ACTN|nr:hypothetical protein LRS13_12660 [Parviterribacteraceae bacterium J379]
MSIAKRSFVPRASGVLIVGVVLLVSGCVVSFLTFLLISGKGASESAIELGGPIAEAALPLVGIDVDTPSVDGASMLLVSSFLASVFAALLGAFLTVPSAALLAFRGARAGARMGTDQIQAAHGRLRHADISLPGLKRGQPTPPPRQLTAGQTPEAMLGDPLFESAIARSNIDPASSAPHLLEALMRRDGVDPAMLQACSHVNVHHDPSGSSEWTTVVLAILNRRLIIAAAQADDILTWHFGEEDLAGGRFDTDEHAWSEASGEYALCVVRGDAAPVIRLGWQWDEPGGTPRSMAVAECQRVYAETLRAFGQDEPAT